MIMLMIAAMEDGCDYYVGNGTYRVSSTAKIYNVSETLPESETAYSARRSY